MLPSKYVNEEGTFTIPSTVWIVFNCFSSFEHTYQFVLYIIHTSVARILHKKKRHFTLLSSVKCYPLIKFFVGRNVIYFLHYFITGGPTSLLHIICVQHFSNLLNLVILCHFSSSISPPFLSPLKYSLLEWKLDSSIKCQSTNQYLSRTGFVSSTPLF